MSKRLAVVIVAINPAKIFLGVYHS